MVMMLELASCGLWSCLTVDSPFLYICLSPNRMPYTNKLYILVFVTTLPEQNYNAFYFYYVYASLRLHAAYK